MVAKKSSRRVLKWEKIKSPRAISAVLISTALGAGLFPIAPGTMGTLVAVPLAYYSASWPSVARALMWLGLLAIGTWSAKAMDEINGSKDNQNIVIDEVVGLGITAWTAGTSPKTLIAAFLLFRFFDIVKPPPVRQMDEWSKVKASQSHLNSALWWGGFGVMADDVLAGFQGLAVVMILQFYGWLP